MVVEGTHADAQKWRHLGPFPSDEEAFEDERSARAASPAIVDVDREPDSGDSALISIAAEIDCVR